MGSVSFTARRSLLPGHVDGQEISLEVDLQDAIRSRIVRKRVVRAGAGQTETLYLGADTKWSLTFEPAAADLFDRLTEFLDSTATGESFRVWAYGDEAAPLLVRRMDDGYAPQPFIRTGNKRTDPFVMSISVIEVPS